MIQANTEIGRSMYDNMALHGSVLINVPEQLKPITKVVLTRELFEILKTIDKIDPDIILNAQEMLIEKVRKEVEDEQN
jgi:hypothetical protein